MLVSFRRLSRLSACRRIAVSRGPLSFGTGKAYYYTPSFSARPNNSLIGKILYQKNGVPRSKLLGLHFVFFVLFTGVAFKTMLEYEDQQQSLVFLVRVLQSNIDTSSADLSTPRGAIEHFRDLISAGMDESNGRMAVHLYDFYIGKLESGQLSPDKVEMLHQIAKEGCEAAHKTMELLKVKSEEVPVEEKAVELQENLADCMTLMHETFEGAVGTKETKNIVGALEAMDKKRKKEDDSYDTVD